MTSLSGNQFTEEEWKIINSFRDKVGQVESEQLYDLMANCKNKYRFAKTHSVFIKDWEKTRQGMSEAVASGKVPLGTTPAIVEEMICIGDDMIKSKLFRMQMFFQLKWSESIFNYLGPDGKTKKLFGLFG
jgi:thermostable 8-oxoguanine DNA glycosylase